MKINKNLVDDESFFLENGFKLVTWSDKNAPNMAYYRLKFVEYRRKIKGTEIEVVFNFVYGKDEPNEDFKLIENSCELEFSESFHEINIHGFVDISILEQFFKNNDEPDIDK